MNKVGYVKGSYYRVLFFGGLLDKELQSYDCWIDLILCN